jgi:hypothetical protein
VLGPLPTRLAPHPVAPSGSPLDLLAPHPVTTLQPAFSQPLTASATPGRPTDGRASASASSEPPVPRPWTPLSDTAASPGADAAGGGLGFSSFCGVAALLTLMLAIVPGVIWALGATAQMAAPQPFLRLLERPG